MDLEHTQPLTEMSTRNISCGAKAAGTRADNFTSFMSRLSTNLVALTSWNPQGLSMYCSTNSIQTGSGTHPASDMGGTGVDRLGNYVTSLTSCIMLHLSHPALCYISHILLTNVGLIVYMYHNDYKTGSLTMQEAESSTDFKLSLYNV
jgi:hypothetical protein